MGTRKKCVELIGRKKSTKTEGDLSQNTYGNTDFSFTFLILFYWDVLACREGYAGLHMWERTVHLPEPLSIPS